MLLSKVVLLLSPTVFFSVVSCREFVVDTGYAKYLGNNTFPRTVAYLGIPYAEPPLGEKRYRAPEPLNTTRISAITGNTPIDARSYADFCIQGVTSNQAGGAGSEDCLKVDIYAPTTGKNLPVLVYTHGGGYIFGNPATWPFDHWISQSPNVVIVSVYYRLSSFGFLTAPEFTDSSLGDFNAGFLDQVEALKWVQKNIKSFGGDPNKVTLNGQSAGGGSVQLHLVANHGHEGLFTGAIPQSIYRAPMPTPDLQKPLFDFFTEQAGCGQGDIVAKMACLRAADLSTLTRAQDLSQLNRTLLLVPGAYNTFHPVVDGEVFTDTPTASLLAGNFAKVPVLVGATSNETGAASGDLSTLLPLFWPGLQETDLAEFAEVYNVSTFNSSSQQIRVAIGHSEFICGQTIVGNAYSRSGLDVWAYRYNQRNPTFGTSGLVEHAAENWMMFRGSNTGINGTGVLTDMTELEQDFAAELIAYWLSFVRTGNPNTFKLSGSPKWEGYTTRSKKRMVLEQADNNAGSFMETEPSLEAERCAFVAKKAKQEQN